MSDNFDVSIEPMLNNSSPSSIDNSTVQNLHSEFDVFISYRTNPDQGLANALKKLLEESIEPRPKVFAAGAGGLRPSNIGYKPQIQAAVQSSKAFIAIIIPL